MLRDGEMPVISRHRAQKLHLFQLTPWRTAHYAMGHGTGYRIIHYGQAGITAYNHIVRGYTHNICHHMLGLRYAVQNSVITHIHFFQASHISLRIQHVKDIHTHIQLGHAGLPSGHIQLQPSGLRILIFLRQLRMQLLQFLSAQVLVSLSLHDPQPSLSKYIAKTPPYAAESVLPRSKHSTFRHIGNFRLPASRFSPRYMIG